MLTKLLFIFLILALLTGGLTFGGFIAGGALLLLFKILFPIFALLFIISLVKVVFFPGPKV